MNGHPKQSNKKPQPQAQTTPPAGPDFPLQVVMTRMFAEYLERMRAAGAIDSACGREWHGWIGVTDDGIWWLDASWRGKQQERMTAGSVAELRAKAGEKFGG